MGGKVLIPQLRLRYSAIIYRRKKGAQYCWNLLHARYQSKAKQSRSRLLGAR
jgi:hypothetical protein